MIKEVSPADPWLRRLADLVTRFNEKGCYTVLVTNRCMQRYNDAFKNANLDEILYFSFEFRLIYCRLLENQESVVSTNWDASLQKWLLLLGKLGKPNRLPFFHALVEQDEIADCEWSLYVNDHQVDAAKPYLELQGITDALAWLRQYERQADSIDPALDDGFHYYGIPYGDIYSRTLFQVIPEALGPPPVVPISEKTWLSILNHRPFLIYGCVGSNKALRQQGFNTFDDYLIDDDFDQPLPRHLRVKSLIQNIKHWQHTLQHNAKSVNEIIRHNYHHLLDLIKSNNEIFESFCIRNRLPVDFDLIMEKVDPVMHKQWHRYYERIRDASWPDCPQEKDFNLLPEWIQKECIEIHGYQPKDFK
jgi:hypothetical protein